MTAQLSAPSSSLSVVQGTGCPSIRGICSMPWSGEQSLSYDSRKVPSVTCQSTLCMLLHLLPKKRLAKQKVERLILEEPKQGRTHSDISSQSHSPDTPLFSIRYRSPHTKQVQSLQDCKPQPLAALGCRSAIRLMSLAERGTEGNSSKLTTDTHESNEPCHGIKEVKIKL